MLRSVNLRWPSRADWQATAYRLRRLASWQTLKRHWRWLLLPPALGFVALLALYLSIASNFTSPSSLILGAKGLEILDRNGEVVYTFSDQPGSSRITPLSEISPDVVNATVATEDANYWHNPGVNLRGLVRAVYDNLAFWKHGGFFKGSGGSSISQQLAKNLYIAPGDRIKRSPIRKIKETLIAFELTRRYSKQQIMEWYLSNIFYGHGAYGIESASYRYFNKPPSDLTLAEAALLAGIPRAPAVYDPIADFDTAMARQQEVIDLMVRHGLLSREDADAALQAPVNLREGRDPALAAAESKDQLAPHFATYVRELLPSLISQDQLKGELRVTTTLDATLQAKAQDIVSTKLDGFEKTYDATNGALVAIDPTTGEVLAMVGSHDFNRDDISGQVNNAISLNQPGSTIKPITYLSAFIKGWSPSTIIVDEPITLSDGDSNYVLNNADFRYRGAVSAREALGSSLNVPAVKTLAYAGLPQVLANAKRLGITTFGDADQYGPAFTLGGADVNLLDLTYVYSVFADQGQQNGISSVLGLPKGSRDLDPVAVLKVETVDGKTLYQAKPRSERLFPANAVYLITNILSDDNARVSGFGADSTLDLPGRPAAVKSGSSDASRDAWTVGYTPQLVTGVWVGNANNTPMPGATSTNTAAPIWSAFMQAALQDKPAQAFAVPGGIEFDNVCAATGQAPTAGCAQVVKEVFLSGHGPSGASPPSPVATSTRAAVTLTATPQATSTPGSVTPSPSLTPRPTLVLTRPPTLTPRPQPTQERLTATPALPTQAAPTLTPRLVPTSTPVRPPTNTPFTPEPSPRPQPTLPTGITTAVPPTMPVP